MTETYQYIIEKILKSDIDREVGIELLNKIKKEEKGYSDKIAIIGISAHYPNADGIHDFWELLANSQDCMGVFPKNRQNDLNEYVKEKHGVFGDDIYAKGGYLSQIDLFDHAFFKIPYKEAERMDPNQRLFLQTAYEALEDAGYGGDKIKGSRTGVFLGYSNSLREDYSTYVKSSDQENNSISVQANLESIIPSRLSYFLNLKGPSITFDTACSSSLIAIQAATDSLKKRESNMAIAAGMKINFYLLENGIKLGIESKRLQTRAFDNLADGVGVGEGIGVVVLKRFEDAVRDKDHIYATILGSASNQDGYSAGITVPNVDSQTDVLISAWENAHIPPETIGYIETHGTGTKIGDPIEVEALTNAFSRFTTKKQFCGIGSVKSNLGHLYEGAGMASFLKAILCLYKKKIPSSIHFQVPNDRIEWMNAPVYVNDQLFDWEPIFSSSGEKVPRRCGVSAFGLSGTNCHIVLEEYESDHSEHLLVQKSRMFVISSYEYEGLHQLAKKYCEYVTDIKNLDLDAFCEVLYLGRGHYNHRLAFTFEDQNDLLEKLVYFEKYGSEADGMKGIHYKQIIPSVEYQEKDFKVCIPIQKIDELSEQAKIILEEGNQLDELCQLYSRGAIIPWEKMICQDAGIKLSLPLYVYKPTRCWLPYISNQVSTQPLIENVKRKFVERPLICNQDEDLYQCTLSAQKDFVLSDHVIMEKPTLPGTAYLEIACEIARNYMNTDRIQMNGFKFMMPIILNQDEERTVQIRVIKLDKEYKLSFYSQKNGIELTHAEVKLTEQRLEEREKIDIDSFCKQANEKLSISQNELTKGFIQFGKHWLNYHKIYRSDGEGVAYLKMPEEVNLEPFEFILPPSLVDMGVNAMSLLLGEPYLPLYYKKIRIYGALPNEIFSYVKMKDKSSNNSETMTYDVTFTDMEGNVLAVFEDYSVKKVRDIDQFGKEMSISTFQWIPSTYEESQDFKCAVIFENNSKRAHQLWDELVRNGKTVIYIHEAEQLQMEGAEWYVPNNEQGYQSIFEKLSEEKEEYSQVIQFFDGADDLNNVLIDELEQKICKVLTLSKVLCKKNMAIRYTAVTEHAYHVVESDNTINKVSAMLTGLCRTLRSEKHSIVTQCVDFDCEYSATDLMQALTLQPVTDYVAYRNHVRYEPQIDLIHDISNTNNEIELYRNGVYLITGGCGGIGIKTAELLAKHENVKIVLVNRKQFAERSQWYEILENEKDSEKAFVIRSILHIEELGSQVYFRNADISEEEQVKKLLEDVNSEIGQIRGIIHSAGVAGGGLIQSKEWSEVMRVFAPKVKGTYYLEKYIDAEKLDFMLLFSSIAAFAATPGQVDYSMANIYLDAFSEDGLIRGKKIITVNWPAWNDIGMAVKHQNINEKYIRSIHSNDAMYVLWNILQSGYRHVVVGEWNSNEINDISGIRIGHNLQNMAKQNAEIVQKENNTKHVPVKLEGRMDDDYTDEEKIISEIWGNVLGLDTVNIYANFNDIGGNSIFAVKMMDILNEKYPDMFDITDMFSYSSIYQLAEHIREIQGASEKDHHPEEMVEDVIGEDSEEQNDELEEMLRRLQNGEIDVSEVDEWM